MKKAILAFTALLLLGTLALGGILAGCKTSTDNDGGQTGILEDISAAEAYNLIQGNMMNPGFVIIDVRTADEYNAGHLEGAINIDFYASDFASQLDMLDKSKVYLLYCRSANRSHQALEIMEGLGFTEAYNMTGGIDAWKGAGYSTVK